MSVQELAQRVQALPPAELQEFAAWWAAESGKLLLANQTEGETEAVKTELLRRQQEYHDHPERFTRIDEAGLKGMFERIANARAHLTSAHRS
jgi:hypothetical protein